MNENAVWVIEYCEEDNKVVIGICSTLEKAKATIKFYLTKNIKISEDELEIMKEDNDVNDPYMKFLMRNIKKMKVTLSSLDNPLYCTEGYYFRIHDYRLTKMTVDKIY
jgi:hypothetical protein